MKKINISVVGALGRMGKLLVKQIIKDKKFNLKSITDIHSGKYVDKFRTENNNLEAFKKTDIIIDFSRPKVSLQILHYAKKLKIKVIIGTTGFTKIQDNLIKDYSKHIAIFKSGNMSLGINLLEHITQILSKIIPNNYNILIKDNHHIKKIDYPSGTALMLAKAVANGKNKNLKKIRGKNFLNTNGKFTKNKINFMITRRGNTIGEHSVSFNNIIENIELKHASYSRELFVRGALAAAIWISKKKRGLFNMQDMFNLK
jgi:4-hydroxy-tetrahydrodipicolinate reductase